MSGVEVFAWIATNGRGLMASFPVEEQAREFVGTVEGISVVPVYSQATVDTLRAQLEAAEAELEALKHDVKQYMDSTLAENARAEAAETREARLLHAGAMLANCAFNLAQREHLSADERRSLDESRIAWDAARTKEQQA